MAQQKTPTWQVMISSRMVDFTSERDAAEQAITSAGMLPWVIERPPFRAPTVRDLCQQMAEACDLFLLILGPSYGSQPDGQPAGHERSATHLEYEWASAVSQRTAKGDRARDQMVPRCEVDVQVNRLPRAGTIQDGSNAGASRWRGSAQNDPIAFQREGTGAAVEGKRIEARAGRIIVG